MSRRPTKPPTDPTDSGDALWKRVTATVRPLGKKGPAPGARPLPRVRIRETPVEAPDVSSRRQTMPAETASLDGAWDRRVRTGRVDPERTIDLHGHTRDAAYALLADAIERAWRDDIRTLLVITGKSRPVQYGDERPRGVIAANFAQWLDTPRLRPFIAATRRAHPRHGGSGAWYVIIRKKRG